MKSHFELEVVLQRRDPRKVPRTVLYRSSLERNLYFVMEHYSKQYRTLYGTLYRCSPNGDRTCIAHYNGGEW